MSDFSFTSLLHRMKNAIKSANIYLVMSTVIVLIAGSMLRINNLSNLGLYIDTSLQYTWAKSALEMGIVGFWKNYHGFYDYLPGSLFLFTALAKIARLVSDNEYGFVAVLKLFNWSCDLTIIAMILYVAKKYGKFSSNALFCLIILLYLLPSLWFVSVVWGQIDGIAVVATAAPFLLLYHRAEKAKKYSILKDPALWAGIILALGFWIKMQVILVFPALFIYFISLNYKKQIFIRFIVGFCLLTFLITIIPAIASPRRLKTVVLTPLTRDDAVSNGAATLWQLVDMNGKGSDKVITINNDKGITVSQAGVIMYLLFMVPLYLRLRGIRVKELWKYKLKPRSFFTELFPKNLSIQQIFMFITMSSALYFMLFTKMHSRYLHLGIAYSLFTLTSLPINKQFWKWLIPSLLLNFSYFLNQIMVYANSNSQPQWVFSIYYNIHANLPSLLSLTAIELLYLWIWLYSTAHYVYQSRESVKKI